MQASFASFRSLSANNWWGRELRTSCQTWHLLARATEPQQVTSVEQPLQPFIPRAWQWKGTCAMPRRGIDECARSLSPSWGSALPQGRGGPCFPASRGNICTHCPHQHPITCTVAAFQRNLNRGWSLQGWINTIIMRVYCFISAVWSNMYKRARRLWDEYQELPDRVLRWWFVGKVVGSGSEKYFI